MRTFMTVRKVIYLPDHRLRAPTESIEIFDQDLQTLIDDMLETMYAYNGVGLAAPQIGISKKLAVIDATGERTNQLILINPEIVEREGEALMEEGCLSVPGPYDRAPRALRVKMRALDRNGKPYEIDTDGHLAHIFQHEIDHLSGKLYVDYLSPLKRKMALKKMEKQLKERDK